MSQRTSPARHTRCQHARTRDTGYGSVKLLTCCSCLLCGWDVAFVVNFIHLEQVDELSIRELYIQIYHSYL